LLTKSEFDSLLSMKVISLVPSITETLIEAGVEVVGRTRFCIHPSEKVKSISIVGGTKNIDWQKVEALKADALILDKEENPKSFAENSPIPYFAYHFEDVASCAKNYEQMAKDLKSPALNEIAGRFEKLRPRNIPLNDFVDWVKPPSSDGAPLEYIIWKNPIMAVGRNTFIGSVLKYLGHELPIYETKYPKLSDVLSREKTYLFSSEPFPFMKHKDWIGSTGVASGLVDGESFSWFGIRSLRFLEKILKTDTGIHK
jgi:hypothetical protein